MKLAQLFVSATLSASLILSSQAYAQGRGSGPGALENQPIEPTVTEQVEEQFLEIHNTMHDDVGMYARDVYVGHILSPQGNINTLAQRGLTSLVLESYARTSIQPAGVVGIDLNDPATLDNLPLIAGFLYFPITNETPRLSSEARHALQNYIASGGVIVLDVVGGGRINTSEPLRNIIDDLQIRPPERLEEGHALSQSFYFSELAGSNASADVWVERSAENLGEAGATSVIIADQNWAGAWSSITVDAEQNEAAIWSGLNILVYSLTGLYKNDPIHQETIEQKREYLEEEAQRLREQALTAD